LIFFFIHLFWYRNWRFLFPSCYVVVPISYAMKIAFCFVLKMKLMKIINGGWLLMTSTIYEAKAFLRGSVVNQASYKDFVIMRSTKLFRNLEGLDNEFIFDSSASFLLYTFPCINSYPTIEGIPGILRVGVGIVVSVYWETIPSCSV